MSGADLDYASPLTTLAFIWRLDRRDGITLGLTSHDRDLMIDGLIYRAAPGMIPSAIEQDDGFEPERVTLSAALRSDLISGDDLASGRWDGARLRLSLVDWHDLDAAPLLLAQGELGLVESGARGFSAVLRGPAAALEAPVTGETSPTCRAQLGDVRCGVAMAARRRIARVTGAVGAQVMLDFAAAEQIYAAGMLRWLDGANAGLDSPVAASSGMSVTLREPPAFAVEAGTRALLIEGCDRRFSTCAERFANAANFRGEPHLPGNDLLLRYGG
jgi:uncharacterized phage protein (TIGR02218 family)